MTDWTPAVGKKYRTKDHSIVRIVQYRATWNSEKNRCGAVLIAELEPMGIIALSRTGRFIRFVSGVTLHQGVLDKPSSDHPLNLESAILEKPQ